jgi:hypothetical protein
MGLSDLFGDEGERDEAMRRAFQQYKTEMTQYLSDFESRFGDIISMVESDRDVDIEAFTQGFQISYRQLSGGCDWPVGIGVRGSTGPHGRRLRPNA